MNSQFAVVRFSALLAGALLFTLSAPAFAQSLPDQGTASCPTLTRTLKPGSSGGDVSQLQAFLAQDPSVYPEAQITGYYGALTRKAVERWQIRHNIVSGGTSETTGFGVAGPRTVVAIAFICTGKTSSMQSSGTPGSTSIVATISGPQQVTVGNLGAWTIKMNFLPPVQDTFGSRLPIAKEIDWGDGITGDLTPETAAEGSWGIPMGSTNTTFVFHHTYQKSGTYTIIYTPDIKKPGAVARTTIEVVDVAPAPQTTAPSAAATQSSNANTATNQTQSCTPTSVYSCTGSNVVNSCGTVIQSCASGQTCNAGACVAQAAKQSCAFAGQTVKDGGTVLAFKNPDTTTGSGCDTAEVRTCTNGTLSGSYTNATCAWTSTSATPPPTPMLNPVTCLVNNTIAHFSWNTVPGNISYVVRMNMPLNRTCSGALINQPGGSCDPTSKTATLFATHPTDVEPYIEPGVWYAWWVHAVDSSGNYSSVTAQTFKCPVQ